MGKYVSCYNALLWVSILVVISFDNDFDDDNIYGSNDIYYNNNNDNSSNNDNKKWLL